MVNTIKYGTPYLCMFQLKCIDTVGNLLAVVSDLEFLGRQAGHSRSVPIV